MMGPSSLFLQDAVESTVPIPPWGNLCLSGVETGYSIGSLMSYSLQPHGLQPTRLLCSWDSPGKNTQMSVFSYSRGSSQPRDQTCVSCISCICRQILQPPGNSRLLCRVDPRLPSLGMDFYLYLELFKKGHLEPNLKPQSLSSPFLIATVTFSPNSFFLCLVSELVQPSQREKIDQVLSKFQMISDNHFIREKKTCYNLNICQSHSRTYCLSKQELQLSDFLERITAMRQKKGNGHLQKKKGSAIHGKRNCLPKK